MSKSVILFKSKSCANCQRLLPIFKETVESLKDTVESKIVDITEEIQEAVEKGVLIVPTIIFFKDNQEVTRLSGVVTKEKIEQTINKI